MTKIALIIGFQYDDDVSEKMGKKYLPGTLLDLYRIYKTISNSDFDQIVILSDIVITNADMYDAITHHDNIGADIHSLKSKIIPYVNKEQIKALIIEVLHSKFGLLYYSGHSIGSKLLLPGEEYISDTDMYLWMLDITSDDIETIFIFDCCHGHNFLLAYNYDGHVYRLVNEISRYFSHKIISICASQSHQVSYSDSDGSYLTKSIFSHLYLSKPPITKINDLYKRLTTDIMSSTGTHPTIYSSYPNIHFIWPWLITPISWSVLYDTYYGNMIIKL